MSYLLEKIKEYWKKYWVIIVSGFVSAVLCFSFMVTFFNRNYAIGMIKNQFGELERVLNSLGYDYAYDNVTFYSFSPWQIMRIKNLRIYSLDEDNFVQWSIDDFNVDVGLWKHNKIRVFLGSKQSLQIGKDVWNVYLPDSELDVKVKANNFQKAVLKANDIVIKNLIDIKDLSLAIDKNKMSSFEVELDVKAIHIDDMTGWKLNKDVDHVYIKSSLQDYLNFDMDIAESLYEWSDRGGKLVVEKMILNWKPLIMVANGDVSFNKKFEPKISLNTASFALIETLEKLNTHGFISNKGTFVVKILLNNKAVRQKSSDKYKMVKSPLKITKDKVLLENIRIR